jgi:probable HAF family extracellular repeat protein
MIDLGTLPGGGGFAIANDVNNRGSVVGASDDAANAVRAVLWTKRRGSGHR